MPKPVLEKDMKDINAKDINAKDINANEPKADESNEEEEVWQGAICLGHIIPGPRKLDKVLNRGGLIPFPADMPVYPSQTWGLSADIARENNKAASGEAKGPVSVVPVDMTSNVRLVFKDSVENHAEFDRVDTMIFNPTEEFEKDMIAHPKVQAYLKKLRFKHVGLNFWSLYMISGIATAIGASGSQEEAGEKNVGGGVGAEAPGIAGGNADFDIAHRETTKTSFKKASDFVWAVRLTEISKSLFSSEFEEDVYIKGASFGGRDTDDDRAPPALEDTLKQMRLSEENFTLVSDLENDVFLIVQDNAIYDESDSSDEPEQENNLGTGE